MTCKIIFSQFGLSENYFTRIFFDEILLDEKKRIMVLNHCWNILPIPPLHLHERCNLFPWSSLTTLNETMRILPKRCHLVNPDVKTTQMYFIGSINPPKCSARCNLVYVCSRVVCRLPWKFLDTWTQCTRFSFLLLAWGNGNKARVSVWLR